jgi:hypothetical protein
MLQYSQGKHDMAEKNMRKAIDLSIKEHGPKDIRVIAWRTRLEGWLRERGREVEGQELRAQIDQNLGPRNIGLDPGSVN